MSLIDSNKKVVRAEVVLKKQLFAKLNLYYYKKSLFNWYYEIFSRLKPKHTKEIFLTNKTNTGDICCKYTCCADGCYSEDCKTRDCSYSCCKEDCCVD